MKNIADLKRAITIGTKLECIDHYQEARPATAWSLARPEPIGQIVTVNSKNTVGFTTDTLGEGTMYHHGWPKAATVAFEGDTWRVVSGIQHWGYRILPS